MCEFQTGTEWVCPYCQTLILKYLYFHLIPNLWQKPKAIWFAWICNFLSLTKLKCTYKLIKEEEN